MGLIGLPELFILFVVAVPYLLPTIIAASRHKTNVVAIAVVNLLLGWTVIGWIVALVWALSTGAVDIRTAMATVEASRLCPHCGKYSGQCGQPFTPQRDP